MGDVRDVITCAKFQIEIFVGYDFTGGRIFDFCIDFSMGLTTVSLNCSENVMLGDVCVTILCASYVRNYTNAYIYNFIHHQW